MRLGARGRCPRQGAGEAEVSRVPGISPAGLRTPGQHVGWGSASQGLCRLGLRPPELLQLPTSRTGSARPRPSETCPPLGELENFNPVSRNLFGLVSLGHAIWWGIMRSQCRRDIRTAPGHGTPKPFCGLSEAKGLVQYPAGGRISFPNFSPSFSEYSQSWRDSQSD